MILEILLLTCNCGIGLFEKSVIFIGFAIFLLVNSLFRNLLFYKRKNRKNLTNDISIRKDPMLGTVICLTNSAIIFSIGVLTGSIMMFFKEFIVVSDILIYSSTALMIFDFFVDIILLLIYPLKTNSCLKTLYIFCFGNINMEIAVILCNMMILYHIENLSRYLMLTGVVFSIFEIGILLLGLWKVLISSEHTGEKYIALYNRRIILFTRVSYHKDIMIVIGKIILACYTVSWFLFVNAVYTAVVGIAKFKAIKVHNKNMKEQIQSYFEIGLGIIVAGLIYIVYSLRMFYHVKIPQFNMETALMIALYTFVELGFIIKDLIKARKSNDILSEELKLIGFSSILISLVLTQIAIMSISYAGNASTYNGISGILFGSLSVLEGIYMVVRHRKIRKQY